MLNREVLLCGCEMVWSDSGLVVAVDTCGFCAALGAMNVQAARSLQYGVREGSEADADAVAPQIEPGRMPDPLQFPLLGG